MIDNENEEGFEDAQRHWNKEQSMSRDESAKNKKQNMSVNRISEVIRTPKIIKT